MSEIRLQNNFKTFQEDFKKDTGLTYNDQNRELYIQYYNARVNDYSHQILAGIMNGLSNRIDRLPENISLRIAEMIRDHEIVKQLLKTLGSQR